MAFAAGVAGGGVTTAMLAGTLDAAAGLFADALGVVAGPGFVGATQAVNETPTPSASASTPARGVRRRVEFVIISSLARFLFCRG